MIKVKLIEILNCIEILTKVGNYQGDDINIKFKYKLMLLLENLLKYQQQYIKQLQDLVNYYEITIQDNQYYNEDIEKLNKFLQEKYDLEDIEMDINQHKILFDKDFNKFSFNQMLILKPFFDYSEIE